MFVILIKPVRKLGSVGRMVDVKSGFGRNYLIPKGFAIAATKKNRAWINQEHEKLEKNNNVVKNEAIDLAKKIDNLDFTFVVQSSSDGKLFGTITSRNISKVMESSGFKIHHTNIKPKKQIKVIGVFEVLVELHPEVSANIIVNVAKSETEALEAINEFKKFNNSEKLINSN